MRLTSPALFESRRVLWKQRRRDVEVTGASAFRNRHAQKKNDPDVPD